jgi:hypothetical protein
MVVPAEIMNQPILIVTKAAGDLGSTQRVPGTNDDGQAGTEMKRK